MSQSIPRFIAEVSSNHHQDLDRCRQFIDVAADIGCDAVKFQLFRIDQLFAPEVLARSADHRARRQWELPTAFLPQLLARCRERDIAFSCTPFDLQAVEELREFVDFYKIASYELLWHDLLRAAAATGKPMILSTGMADLDEVRAAAAVVAEADVQFLHCSSAYPTPVAEANLAAIDTIREAVGRPVGWSDHTRNPAVIQRAIHRWDACTVEFHLDLDGEGGEFRSGHCWLPDEIKPVIADIREAFSADGHGRKEPNAAELPDRPWRADPEDGLRPLKTTRAQLGDSL